MYPALPFFLNKYPYINDHKQQSIRQRENINIWDTFSQCKYPTHYNPGRLRSICPKQDPANINKCQRTQDGTDFCVPFFRPLSMILAVQQAIIVCVSNIPRKR